MLRSFIAALLVTAVLWPSISLPDGSDAEFGNYAAVVVLFAEFAILRLLTFITENDKNHTFTHKEKRLFSHVVVGLIIFVSLLVLGVERGADFWIAYIAGMAVVANSLLSLSSKNQILHYMFWSVYLPLIIVAVLLFVLPRLFPEANLDYATLFIVLKSYGFIGFAKYVPR